MYKHITCYVMPHVDSGLTPHTIIMVGRALQLILEPKKIKVQVVQDAGYGFDFYGDDGDNCDDDAHYLGRVHLLGYLPSVTGRSFDEMEENAKRERKMYDLGDYDGSGDFWYPKSTVKTTGICLCSKYNCSLNTFNLVWRLMRDIGGCNIVAFGGASYDEHTDEIVLRKNFEVSVVHDVKYLISIGYNILKYGSYRYQLVGKWGNGDLFYYSE